MNITLIFFFYGLAFFSMGLAMLLEARRYPMLAETRVLMPLAVFGLIHGGHEWFEMFLERSDWWQASRPEFILWLRIFILTVSFIPLSVFAWRSINPAKTYLWKDFYKWAILFSLYVGSVLIFGYLSGRSHPDGLIHIEAMVRLAIAVPAAVMAGIAWNKRAKEARNQGKLALATNLQWAGFGFILYGLTQVLVPPLDVFPATLINASAFQVWTGLPIQFIRAILAVIIMMGLVNATHRVESERQANFRSEQQARFVALEQLKNELLEKEKLRQEMLRHIVMAQEDERTRIARELHDETSQLLTGFSLHLAALDEVVASLPEAHQHIRYLQALSKQISQGLYRMIKDLRPAQLDDLGMVAALKFLAGDVQQRFNLQVDLQTIGKNKRLDSTVETVFYRIAQEALTNVARHAHTQQAMVVLRFDNDTVTLEISDQGAGFSPDLVFSSLNCWGLTGMKERAESVDGKLDICSQPQHGTIVTMSVSSRKNSFQG